tara:strand:- start:304 stop:720 length:417 start_codon:yes stop_codon:yes gene_type:complete
MTLAELLELHQETTDRCRQIMEQKNNDYTGGKEADDVFANFRCSTILDVHPVTGIMMRVMDKIQRIKTFTNDGQLSVSGETVDDACEDIINYAILAKAMFRQERESKPYNLKEKTSCSEEDYTALKDTFTQSIKEKIL